MYRPPLIGFTFGILFTIFSITCRSILQESGFSENVLVPMCTPMAYVISWITGISTSHESGMMLLAYSLFITPALLGLVVGFMYSGIKVILNRRTEHNQ